jgi:uncharacterized radical SAM superfamily Fe-S cluster-containing enzyme
VPLTRFVSPKRWSRKAATRSSSSATSNCARIVFELFATNHSPESQACSLSDLLCCLPQIQAPRTVVPNVFRVLIMQFIDAMSFDLRAVKKSCVHIAQPDGTIVPFDTFNLFYRDERREQLTRLRAAADCEWRNLLRSPAHVRNASPAGSIDRAGPPTRRTDHWARESHSHGHA